MRLVESPPLAPHDGGNGDGADGDEMLEKNASPWRVRYPRGGPINDRTSRCRMWWNSPVNKPGGPGLWGAKRSAEAIHKRNTKYRQGLYSITQFSNYKTGNGWMFGQRWGCTSPIISNHFHSSKDRPTSKVTVCGCYEMWCRTRGFQLLRRHKCYTVRKIFGCFRSVLNRAAKKFQPDTWHPDCRDNQGKGFVQVTVF